MKNGRENIWSVNVGCTLFLLELFLIKGIFTQDAKIALEQKIVLKQKMKIEVTESCLYSLTVHHGFGNYAKNHDKIFG